MFTYYHTARFYEIDRAGIVFFARVYEYCHAAFEELQTLAFGHPAAIFESLGFGMPLVHSEADYTSPIRMGDRLRVEARISRFGARSVTIEYRIVGDTDEVLHATVRLVHAFVDLSTFKGMEAPDAFREGMARAGMLVPEAGASQAPTRPLSSAP